MNAKRRTKIINHILADMRDYQTRDAYFFVGDKTTHFMWYAGQESWVMLNDDRSWRFVDTSDLEEALQTLENDQLQDYAESAEI
jgi:hypothetical protein